MKMHGAKAYRTAVGLAIGTALLLFWANGAVGIIGSEDHRGNLLFAGVLAVAVGGAIVTRLRAGGMARTMVAAAGAQALVAAIAVIAGWGKDADPEWPRDILAVTAMFVVLWLLAAWLFRRAIPARTPAAGPA